MREGRGHTVGSVIDVLSALVATEFLALMEVSDRLPGLSMNHLANGDGTMPIASGTEQPTENKSVENLMVEFGMLRSAVIRLVEGHPSQSAKVEAKHGKTETLRAPVLESR
jgi:hypothetical protein